MRKANRIAVFVLTLTMALSMFTMASSVLAYTSISTGDYVIKNVASNKYLNVYGNKDANNTNITIYQKDGTTGQTFTLATNKSWYTLKPKSSVSRMVNVYGSNAKNGSNVCLWTGTGDDTQGWYFDKVSSTQYIIRSADNPQYVLTAAGTSNGSNVKLATYTSGNKYQMWAMEKVGSTPTPTPKGIVFPVKNRKMTSSFQAYRRDYPNGWSHLACDYTSNNGDLNIYAFFEGTVDKVFFSNSCGNVVVIKHPPINGVTVYSHYYHLKKDSTRVKVGNKVTAGQIIATMGSTGDSTGVHLHFAIVNKNIVNSNGTISIPKNIEAYKNIDTSTYNSITHNGVTFYNPEKVFSTQGSIIK